MRREHIYIFHINYKYPLLHRINNNLILHSGFGVIFKLMNLKKSEKHSNRPETT